MRNLIIVMLTSIAAYAQGSNVLYNNGAFMPTTNPSCYGAYSNFSQSATFKWTLWCYDSNNNQKAITSGSITGTGTGGCPSVSPLACPDPNGNAAPTLVPTSQLQSGTYYMWMNIGSNSSIPVMAPFFYTCGPATGSTSPIPASTAQQPTICMCDPSGPSCKSTSPVVIDVTGEGFFLTDVAHGVSFRRGPESAPQQFSWTDPAHHNAWLVKPNADGSVTSMSMNMFGNLSPQPKSSTPNGYLALAYWASQEGCGDLTGKKLDAKSCPAVWSALRLWHDANQDGIAQSGELQSLDDAGITGISLNYHDNRYIDQFGNQFFYRAQIWDVDGNDGNNRCYDVFLMAQ